MTEKGETLTTVFGLDHDQPSDKQLTAIESSRCLTALGNKFREDLPPNFWGTVAAQLAVTVREILNVPISTILAGAWKKYPEFLKFADKEKYPPDVVSMVPLATHTISSAHKPSIKLLIDEKPAGEIDFEVKVTLTLEGAVLAIKDGKFKSLRTGTSMVKGSLACEGAVVLERSSEQYQIPGEIVFGEGIAIV